MNASGRIPWTGLLVIAALAAAAVWIFWGRDTDIGGDTLERVRREGVIKIGFANEAPYGYRDPSTGEVTGEAPEIARVIMQRLGVEKVDPIVAEFGSLISGLRAGRFDVIAAGMYITPERCQQIAFSNPTYVIGEAFLVKAGNPLGLHSYEDVAEHPSVKLGVVGGTVQHGYARAVGVDEDRIYELNDNAQGLAELASGRIDAFGVTRLTAQDLLRKKDDPDLEIASPFQDPLIDGRSVKGYGAFGFRKSDVALLEAFNEALADYIGSEEHLELIAPFGFTRANLPGDVTAAELCAGQE